MKFSALLINEIDIEGFLYVNFIPVIVVFSLVLFTIFNYKTYFNFKNGCPKCGAQKDLLRIKKNKIFKTVGFTDSYRKYSCGKCHFKFYIFNKNIRHKNPI